MSESSPSQPIKVYSSPLSGHAHRVRLMLSLLDLPTEVINVQMPDLKTSEFLAMSPFGQMPVIQDGDVTLPDSTAILVYLATRYDSSGAWIPRDAVSAATVQRWLSMASGEIFNGPNCARLAVQFKMPLDLEKAQATTGQLLAVIEAELSTKAFAAGDQPTIADVAAYSYVLLAPEGDVPLDPYPAINAWLARIEALPGFVPMHLGGLATLGN